MNQKDGRVGLRPKKISDCLKDRDEELSFFRDIQKRGKDQQMSLLHPLADEFDANGNYGLHRMESTGRKGNGFQFLGEATAKYDYNWLKTPPATPLFPSLEMETNGQEMVMQKEIPIIHPLSRFAGKDKSANNSNSNAKNIVPPRYKTPTARPTISSTDKKTKSSAIPLPKSNTKTTENREETKPINSFLASNLTKNENTKPSTTSNPKRRGVSPSVKPRIPAQIQGFPDEKPGNLRTTNRPELATRGRPQIKQADDISRKARSQQSCSPSSTVTRGRKAETDGKVSHQSGNGTQVLGSRMVQKLMNARQGKNKMNVSMDEKSRNIEERVGKITLHVSMNERHALGSLGMSSSKHKGCH